MQIAVIKIGSCGSSQLISILNKMKLNVIQKPFNYLYKLYLYHFKVSRV